MTIDFNMESDESFDFPMEEIAMEVLQSAMHLENCPYETELSLSVADNDSVREMNLQFRNIDRPTDVLSFPSLNFTSPADFSCADKEPGLINPSTNELYLGDIMISAQKVKEQAREYGHSEKREFAFLVAHSILHLLGYDHETPSEMQEMEERQELILKHCNITRDMKEEADA